MYYHNLLDSQNSHNRRRENSSSGMQFNQQKYNKEMMTSNAPSSALAMFESLCMPHFPSSFPGFNNPFMAPPPASGVSGLFPSSTVFPSYVPRASSFIEQQGMNSGFNQISTNPYSQPLNHSGYQSYHSIYPDNPHSNFPNSKNLTETPNEAIIKREISFKEQLKLLEQSLQTKPIDQPSKCECNQGKCSRHPYPRRSSQETRLKRIDHHIDTRHNSEKLSHLHSKFLEPNSTNLSYSINQKNGFTTAVNASLLESSSVLNNKESKNVENILKLTLVERPNEECSKNKTQSKQNVANKTNISDETQEVSDCRNSTQKSESEVNLVDARQDTSSKKTPSSVRKRKLKSGLDLIRSNRKKTSSKPKVLTTLPNMNNQIKLMFNKKRFITNKSSGETLLHRSAKNNKLDIVKYCLGNEDFCDVNVQDNAGYTPLHECSSHGHLEIARLLLEHSADVDACATGDIRPLHDAIENDHIDIARLLLSYGANPYVATNLNLTPLQLSRSKAMTTFLTEFYRDIALEKHHSETDRLSWKFTKDLTDNCYDLFADVPSDEDAQEKEITIEARAKPFVVAYRLSNQSNSLYYLLNDVLETIQISKTEFDNKHSEVEIETLDSKQFQKSAIPNQLEEKFKKINCSENSTISVIAKNELIDKLLGIQTKTVIVSS